MKRLPLYGAELRAPVERTTPKDRDAWPEVGNDSDSDLRGRACQDCALSEGAKRPCIGADGRGYQGPGGVLIVGDVPSRDDESCGRLFVTGTGSKLRNAVKAAGVTNVVYDVALRCYPGKNLTKDKVMTKAMESCRPYLHQTIVEAEPSRVIVMGARAARSVIDAHVPINSVRRGYTWLYNNGKTPIPVFFLNHPVMAARNKFYGAEFDKDLQWALTCDPPTPPPWRAHARLVETRADAQLAYDELNTAEWITFDFETGGRLFNEDFQGLCVAVGGRGSDSPFVWNYPGVYDDLLIWPLQKLLKDPEVKVIGQYVKYDILCALEALGVRTTNVYGDTRLWQKVGNPEADAFLDKMAHLVGMGGHKEEAKKALEKGMRDVRKLLVDPDNVAVSVNGLDGEAANRLGGKPMWPGNAGISPPIDAALRAGKDPADYRFAFIDDDVLLRYCARDVVATDRLAIHFDEKMKTEAAGVQHIWGTVIKPLTPALAKVEEWGMGADRQKIINIGRFFESKLKGAAQRLAPYEVNLNSAPQMRALLFNHLGLKPTKFTKTGAPSTDAEVLHALEGQHPIITDILTFRKYDKLLGTYSVGLVDHIRADKRIHPNVKPDGARSGRLSCTEPNLQNIPSEKEEEGRMLRDCFVAEPGNLIVSLDYSQIELRIAALLSGDPVMAQIYRDGDDFHMRTAKLISKMAWGITPDQVGAKHRREAKVFNFGLLYGMGDGRLARNLGITVQAARQVRAAILGSFKKLAEFIRECERETRSTGFTWTWWDGQQARRRPLYDIADRDEKRKNTAENASFNTPVQGTASEFNTASLIECVDWIVGDCIPARLIIPIHDSLMFEVGEDNLVELVEGAQGIMTSWNSGNIPLVVDVEYGHSWGTMRSFICEGLFNHPCGVKTPNAHCSSHGSTLTDEHKKLCCDCVDLQRVRDATERLDGPAPA